MSKSDLAFPHSEAARGQEPAENGIGPLMGRLDGIVHKAYSLLALMANGCGAGLQKEPAPHRFNINDSGSLMVDGFGLWYVPHSRSPPGTGNTAGGLLAAAAHWLCPCLTAYNLGAATPSDVRGNRVSL